MPPILPATLLVLTLLVGAYVQPRIRRVGALRPADPDEAPGFPDATAAVVVAARDEEADIRGAVLSLLAQTADFPEGSLRVVAVNDRSSDATGPTLDALRAEHPDLRVVHVTELPEGWLGKNHALARGAEHAGEVDFLVFTDADVVFEPGALRAAVDHAVALDLDHLTGSPRVVAATPPLAGMVATFAVLFGLFTRPWRLADPKSRTACGIGALNVVRRTAYERAGGHAAIRLLVDDDLRLGQLLKRRGGRAEFVLARDLIHVPWYPGLRSMLRGLVKNVFAGIDYRISLAFGATLALGAVCVAPAVLVFVPGLPLWERGAFALTTLLQMASAAEAAHRAGLSRFAGLFFPVGVALFLTVLWRSTLTALVTRRVRWRETDYDLAELIDFNRAATKSPAAGS